MLTQLVVKDFALIDEVKIEFHDRFNVLTGETGAGKSIIIDAVSLLLGARASSSDVRYGSSKAIVEGVFSLEDNHPVEALLAEFGEEVDEDRLLVLYREISESGKSTCRLNGKIVTLANFRAVGQQLVNIYGQHDFQAISRREQHLNLLDSLGNSDFKQLQAQVKMAFNEYEQSFKYWQELQQKAAEGNERQEFLQFKVQELNDLNLAAGEDEQLECELELLDNYEKIVSTSDKVYHYLYGDQRSVYVLLTASLDKLQAITEYDKGLAEIAEGLNNMIYQAEDYGLSLTKYRDKMDFDSEKKERMNERKYELDKLKRKYHLSIEEIIEQRDKWQAELDLYENMEQQLEEAELKCQKLQQQFQAVAVKLSTERKKLAQQFGKELVEQLADLAMTRTEFEVAFEEKAAAADGIDQVEFMLSANPGQPLKPLSQIASGGEMSRIMLAFKTVLAQYEEIDTMIFDEIDTGIGGNIVVNVAEKLAKVSQFSQVICVTHAPQIAALANQHFLIQKQVENEQTKTNILPLDGEAEIKELARMLGGEEDFQLQHARELKKKAHS